MNNNDFNNGSNNANDPFLPPTNNDVPAYSARGSQNLNKPANQMANTETLDAGPISAANGQTAATPVATATPENETPKSTQEALFVDISDGEEKKEIVTDIPKEEIIVKEVVEEHVIPEMDKFLTPETDSYPNLDIKPNYANPLPGGIAGVSETPSVVSSPVQEVKEERPAPPPREVNPYTHEEIDGNRFAGVFDNASNPNGVQVEVPVYQERPTLTPPPPSRRASKSKGIPLGTLLLILLFVFGFIFVMFLPEISEFFNSLFSTRRG